MPNRGISTREEAFRYTFNDPLPAFFHIYKINDELINSSEGEASIINISPGGINLETKLDIPDTDEKTIQLSTRFTLNEQEFKFIGEIAWKKEIYNQNQYGVKFFITEEEAREIIDQLKIYSKKHI